MPVPGSETQAGGRALTRRLFFAVWPAPGLQARLAAAGRGYVPAGARPVPEANLHLTLAFIGDADAAYQRCLEQAAETVRGAPFEFALDWFGAFPRAGVAWLGCRRQPEPLVTLARDLNAALEPCGYRPERRPFAAHLTLARGVVRPPRPQAIEPVSWAVEDFCLMASTLDPGGASYTVLRRFALRPDR